jgi:hypothetical protein
MRDEAESMTNPKPASEGREKGTCRHDDCFHGAAKFVPETDLATALRERDEARKVSESQEEALRLGRRKLEQAKADYRDSILKVMTEGDKAKYALSTAREALRGALRPFDGCWSWGPDVEFDEVLALEAAARSALTAVSEEKL